MNKPEDKIEELFQSHINDFDKMPDDSLWESIEANLPPVVRPDRSLWRWGIAAALLLFSLIGYVAYQSFSTRQNKDIISAKENNPQGNRETGKIADRKDTKKAYQTNENELTHEEAWKEKTVRESENNLIDVTENVVNKDRRKPRHKYFSKPVSESDTKLSGLITSQSSRSHRGKALKKLIEKSPEQALTLINKDNEIKDIEENRITVEQEHTPEIVVTKKEDLDRLMSPDYLNGHEGNLANVIPFNTRITFEAPYDPVEKSEGFFKTPSEVYVSLTPSLNYYRVFSSMPINQFNGAGNGGRLGWALQAGVVYPLKLRRFSYRVGAGYFSAQSNFRYNLLSGRQQPIRLNNNTFEYGNIESTQSESRKWQVVELQNDLMYKVRPMQDFILGFKTGANLGQRPVFDVYTGYRFSKAISHRQTFWVEIAYAYALNAQQSSRSTFSYHMDKYSLRVGLNYR
jgi:hypothetical protein